MSLQHRVGKALGIISLVLTVPLFAFGGTNFVRQAQEYAPMISMPGDQVRPALGVAPSGGWVVSYDNFIDGDGYGILAQRLDSTFSALQSPFRVNQQGVDDQENPQISLLNGGGAVIVWQGGKESFQHIFARYLSSSGTFLTGDIQVSTAANYFQVDPVVTRLANGNVVVAWGSDGQEAPGSMQGVYAQILSPVGAKVGGEFLINQTTPFNQRSPALASLSSGNFVAVWVSEQQRFTNSIDIYARILDPTGSPVSGEILVNTGTNVTANPSVAVASDGTFVIAWSELNTAVRNYGWDVFARPFSSVGNGGAVQRINTQQFGDQYAPKLSSLGVDYLAVWTSNGQDGSKEGIYGQFLHGDASHSGVEFGVNTTTPNQQIHPAVVSDGNNRFLVAWSTFNGTAGMDLNAQRFISPSPELTPPAPPLVVAVSSSTLDVSWPSVAPVGGVSVTNYYLYADGAAIPTVLPGNWSSLSGLAPASPHSFTLQYVLTDGSQSPLSAPAIASTWGADANGDGLPDDWQALYWGSNPAKWLPPTARLAPNGPTVLNAFQTGVNPLDPATWLKQSTTRTAQGLSLSWTTQPGLVYQVMRSSDLQNYAGFGSPRLAAGTNDSISLGLTNRAGFFEVMRLRY